LLILDLFFIKFSLRLSSLLPHLFLSWHFLIRTFTVSCWPYFRGALLVKFNRVLKLLLFLLLSRSLRIIFIILLRLLSRFCLFFVLLLDHGFSFNSCLFFFRINLFIALILLNLLLLGFIRIFLIFYLLNNIMCIFTFVLFFNFLFNIHLFFLLCFRVFVLSLWFLTRFIIQWTAAILTQDRLLLTFDIL
jgi:hypothetical protein